MNIILYAMRYAAALLLVALPACALMAQEPNGDNKSLQDQGKIIVHQEDDTPFQMDDVLPDRDRFNVSMRTAFTSSGLHGNVVVLQPVSLTPDIIIQVPSQVDSDITSESLSASLDVSYGLSERWSLFSGISGVANNTSSLTLGIQNSVQTNGLSSWYAGASYALSSADSTWYKTVSVNMPLVQIISGKNVYAKAVTVNFNTFYSYDPLVLSLSASYSHFFERDVDGIAVNPGSILSLSPQASFNVNPDMSLDWGLSISHIGNNREGGMEVPGIGRVQASFDMGLTVSSSDSVRWGFNSSFAVRGEEQVTLGVSALYLPP